MDREGVDRVYRVVVVISLALVLGVVMLGALAYFIVAIGSMQPMGPPLGTPLLAAVAAVGLVVVFVTTRALGSARDRASVRSGADLVRWFQMATIIPQTVKEGVAIAGILLSMFAGSRTWILVFAVSAVVGMLMSLPSKEDVEALARQVDSTTE